MHFNANFNCVAFKFDQIFETQYFNHFQIWAIFAVKYECILENFCQEGDCTKKKIDFYREGSNWIVLSHGDDDIKMPVTPSQQTTCLEVKSMLRIRKWSCCEAII